MNFSFNLFPTLIVLLLTYLKCIPYSEAQNLPWSFIILKEGDNTIYDGKRLDTLKNWYAVYRNDTSKSWRHYYIKKIPTKIVLKEHGDFFFEDTDKKYCTIETGDSLRAQFLIGTTGNVDNYLLHNNMCGSYDLYDKKNGLLIPGQTIGDSHSTLSCPSLELAASGDFSCIFDSSNTIKNYKINILFHNTNAYPDRNYELYLDGVNGSYNHLPLSTLFPHVFWMGDLDHDRKTDFILYFKWNFYLYLTRYAEKNEYAKLIGTSPYYNIWSLE